PGHPSPGKGSRSGNNVLSVTESVRLIPDCPSEVVLARRSRRLRQKSRGRIDLENSSGRCPEMPDRFGGEAVYDVYLPQGANRVPCSEGSAAHAARLGG